MELTNRDYWHRYSRDWRGMGLMGILQEEYQTFRLIGKGGHTIVRSMLSIHELALLYSLARHHYTGMGEIIDLGPLLGASTFALSRGLYDNCQVPEPQRHGRIHSFDLFRAEGYERFLGPSFRAGPAGSLLGEFVRINRDNLDYIVPHQGSLLDWKWGGAPVEILFVDVAKSWELNQHVVNQFFPCLVEGRSVIVQQDYIHFNEYWIHLTMELFHEHFEPLGMLRGATSFYRCVKGFEQAHLHARLSDIPYSEKMEILESARARAPRPVQEVMKIAAAKCAIEHNDIEAASRLLDSVETVPMTDDPILEVSGIAKSNHAVVRQLLAQATRSG